MVLVPYAYSASPTPSDDTSIVILTEFRHHTHHHLDMEYEPDETLFQMISFEENNSTILHTDHHEGQGLITNHIINEDAVNDVQQRRQNHENDLPIESLVVPLNVVNDATSVARSFVDDQVFNEAISLTVTGMASLDVSTVPSATSVSEYRIDSNIDVDRTDMGYRDNDVLFGRGGEIAGHVGNQTFINYRNALFVPYFYADSAELKRMLVERLLNSVYHNGGRFMEKKLVRNTASSSTDSMIPDTSSTSQRRRFGASFTRIEIWVEMTDYNRIYRKVSQAMRDGVLS